VVAAIDGPKETLWRRQIYPPYKTSRKPLDTEKQAALRACLDYIYATGLATVELPDHEADDVLATIVDICAGPSCQCIIATQDKDLGQLVNGQVKLYDGNKFIQTEDVVERWGVRPGLVPEVQALCGDGVDDIPGVPGVGPKTAAAWIQKYGSAQKTFESRAELTPSKQKAMEGYDWQLHIKLVKLRTDLEINLNVPAMRWEGLDMEAIEVSLGGWRLSRV